MNIPGFEYNPATNRYYRVSQSIRPGQPHMASSVRALPPETAVFQWTGLQWVPSAGQHRPPLINRLARNALGQHQDFGDIGQTGPRVVESSHPIHWGHPRDFGLAICCNNSIYLALSEHNRVRLGSLVAGADPLCDPFDLVIDCFCYRHPKVAASFSSEYAGIKRTHIGYFADLDTSNSNDHVASPPYSAVNSFVFAQLDTTRANGHFDACSMSSNGFWLALGSESRLLCGHWRPDNTLHYTSPDAFNRRNRHNIISLQHDQLYPHRFFAGWLGGRVNLFDGPKPVLDIRMPQKAAAKRLWPMPDGLTLAVQTFHKQLLLFDLRFPRLPSVICNLADYLGSDGDLVCEYGAGRFFCGVLNRPRVLAWDPFRPSTPAEGWLIDKWDGRLTLTGLAPSDQAMAILYHHP